MSLIAHPDLGRQLVSICRLHHTRADQAMDRIGLYRGQAILLMILSHEDGITHSEIAARLEISPAAATKVIKRMEQAGYAQRMPDPVDERLSRVFLCEKGRAVIAEIKTAFGELDRAMLAGFPESDLEQLRSLLARMQANLHGYQP